VATYRLMDGASGRPGVGSSGTQPPVAGTPYSGPYIAGTSFLVTTGGLWLQGYEWYVAASLQDTAAVKCALWNPYDNSGGGAVVPGSTVTSGVLTAGQFNFIPLASPVLLAPGSPYIASVGYAAATGFPLTVNQFGTAQPYVSGITNGPLLAFADTGGTVADRNPLGIAQGTFSTAASDPSLAVPLTPFNSGNFWVDILVSDTAPVAYAGSYRIWPGSPYPVNFGNDTANNFTLGTEFTLSKSCSLNKIWFYSQAGVSQLPTECGIWAVGPDTLVAGTHNASPAWSGAAGSGWVSCAYTGVTLASGDYKVSVFNGAGSPGIWNAENTNYWGGGGYGASGFTAGPLAVPNTATATAPGQSTYHQGATFVWPDTYAAASFANYWVDVEVTVSVAASGPIAVTTTPVLIGQVTTSPRRKQAAFITLVNGSVAIYLGGSGVSSANGVAVSANATWQGNLWPGDQLYAVTGSGTSFISVLQT
jgi:Domain of unknown function (DUF4082)